MADELDDICSICNNTREWHRDNGPQHSFTLVGGAASLNQKEPKQPAQPVLRRGIGGDPALRLALINAGVITPAQLMAAEEELDEARSSGSIVVPGPDPDPRSGAPVDGGSPPAHPGPGNRGGS